MKKEDGREMEVIDGRIQALSERFASQGFYFLGGYVLLSTFVKLVFLDLNFVYYIDTFLVFLIACAYYTYRGIKNGIFIPSEKNMLREKRLLAQ
ncbi:hypothetical protein QA612_00010 [Evansella sp. AB-P1]|uniref:DUF6773 family protein n=1 Tax=Evansella sp. AB-P1 TaxID=3037653 RepID=UPI00241DBB51|nr:DUF6773 family protein [Evansella sp. AB-P1]MDG5785855.1 hypothetical protein [Evansella sp. AB-P1]